MYLDQRSTNSAYGCSLAVDRTGVAVETIDQDSKRMELTQMIHRRRFNGVR
jgi:hypothetical protein